MGLASKGWLRGEMDEGIRVDSLSKTIAPGLSFVLFIEPGLSVGRADKDTNQKLLAVVTTGHTAVSLLNPIHTSELIRDMEALRGR